MHQYADAGDLTGLIGLFDHPRAAFVLNISHQDTDTGSTILHSASRRKDMSMVQWCLDQGIDTLLRDKKGKTAADVTKDSKIKNLLRDSRSQGNTTFMFCFVPGGMIFCMLCFFCSQKIHMKLIKERHFVPYRFGCTFDPNFPWTTT